jgi:electron transfer flavoprotein alpha/beta subunit
MKIVVCVQATLVSQDATPAGIRQAVVLGDSALTYVIERSCKAALHLAKQLCGPDDELIAVSYGRADSQAALQYALAFGAHAVFQLQGKENAEHHEPNQVARVLADWLSRQSSLDLVVCGNSSGVGPVPSLIAGYLGIPALPRVDAAFRSQTGALRIRQRLERGWRQELAVRLPAVVSVQAGFFNPMYVSAKRRRSVKEGASKGIHVETVNSTEALVATLTSLDPLKPRAKRQAVPDARASAADRLKALMGSGGVKKAEKSAQDADDGRKIVEAAPEQVAREIIDFLRKKELLPQNM